MTTAVLLALLLVTTFAAWLTVHLALCARLARVLQPKLLVALLLLPPTCALAGYWGFKFGHKRMVVAWGLCLVTYAVLWTALSATH